MAEKKTHLTSYLSLLKPKASKIKQVQKEKVSQTDRERQIDRQMDGQTGKQNTVSRWQHVVIQTTDTPN